MALDFMEIWREEKRKLKLKGSIDICEKKGSPCRLESRSTTFKPSTTDFPAFSFGPRKPIPIEAKMVGWLRSMSYFHDFVSQDEAASIVHMVESVPFDNPRWVSLRGRQLQCWGGQPLDPHSAAASDMSFVSEPLPEWLQVLCESLSAAKIFPAEQVPNHVLINRYECGEGILPHTDGPAYVSRTATLSLSGRDEEAESLHHKFGAVMTFRARQASSEVGSLVFP
jgi:alkylated DNA repair protein alkB family protein 6